ncbi:hypothetical protein HanOQP8_Chr05g0192071 [Helianthus annuus]|nr:hypothetical protein HanOQP8_Chr05g0192071 [Helianthus annuus]
MIQVVGVESLSEEGHHQACRDRGLLGLCSVHEKIKRVDTYYCRFVGLLP